MDITNFSNQNTRNVIIGLGAFLFVCIVFLLWGKEKQVNNNKADIETLRVVESLGSESLNRDIDGDGITDFEEKLMGTNPNVFDDKQNLDKARVEKVESLTEEERKSLDRLNDETNLTSSIAKNVYALNEYIGDQTIGQEEQGALVTDVLKHETAKIYTKYKISDIKIGSTNNVTTYKTYANELATNIFKIISIGRSSDDLTGIAMYSTTSNISYLNVYKQKASQVNTVIAQMEKMLVPSNLSDEHIEALNTASSYRDALLSLGKADTDPMRALIAVRDIEAIIPKGLLQTAELFKHIESLGVVFLPNDAGYSFIK